MTGPIRLVSSFCLIIPASWGLCALPSSPKPDTPETVPSATSPLEVVPQPSAASTDEAQPAADDPAPQRVVYEAVRGLNRGAFELYGKLVQGRDGENVVFSPYGLNKAMGLVSLAARGETETELAHWLNLPADRSQRGQVAEALDCDMRAHASEGTRLLVANRIWAQLGLEPATGFREASQRFFSTSLGRADFAAHPADARAAINAWVHERTDGQITGLLGPDDVPATTRLVLTTALSFKGEWETRFHPVLTQNAPFHREGTGETLLVPMMSGTASFRYGEFEACKALELPYKGKGLAMVVLLPSEGGLSALEAQLSDEMVGRWVSVMESTTVEVHLPRFRAGMRFRADEALRALGVPMPFSDRADFSGLTDGPDSSTLRLDRVVHEAVVEVDEVGTWASSVTSSGWGMRSSPVSFDANRPFIFLIRDQVNGAILFVGRLADPS